MRIALLTSALLVTGCAQFDVERSADRTLSLSDFSSGVAASPKSYYGETPSVEIEEGDLIGGNPDDSDEKPVAPAAPATKGQVDPNVSAHWMVDGLVGQINGRPVFANDFLEPLQDRLKLIATQPSPRANMERLIHDRFQAFVDSELIISEAENQLTPEQQQGVFAWLRSLQEEEIAREGGTRAEANERLERDKGQTIEEFMQQRREEELSRYLLGKKVQPRTIVSWRDVERHYRVNEASINPSPTILFGRISLSKKTDKDKIATVKTMIEGDATFVEIAKAVGAPKDGAWVTGAKPRDKTLEEAIETNESFKTEIKQALRGAKLGRPSAPLEDENTVQWFAVLAVDDPAQHTIFEAELQLRIKDTLRNFRERVEESRYIDKLRTRWISDDINAIEERIIDIAAKRYLK